MADVMQAEQVQQLHDSSAAQGDLLQEAICDIALGRPVPSETRNQLGGAERAKLGRFTQQSAWAECARVFANAAR